MPSHFLKLFPQPERLRIDSPVCLERMSRSDCFTFTRMRGAVGFGPRKGALIGVWYIDGAVFLCYALLSFFVVLVLQYSRDLLSLHLDGPSFAGDSSCDHKTACEEDTAP